MRPDNVIKPSTPVVNTATFPALFGVYASLWIGLLCWMIPASYGIQCFVCDVVHLNSECNGTENIMQCPITYDTCMTMIRYSSDVGKMQISKLCSKREACWTQRRVLSEYAACDANETDEWACVSCCDSHDLCNTNRAGSELGRLPVPASAATAALLVFLWL